MARFVMEIECGAYATQTTIPDLEEEEEEEEGEVEQEEPEGEGDIT